MLDAYWVGGVCISGVVLLHFSQQSKKEGYAVILGNDVTNLCTAVIFCGGRATRLLPVIGKLPKALVKLDNMAYLDSLLFFLRAAGIVKVCLCISPFSRVIAGHIENGSRFSMRVSYSIDSGLVENAGALWSALPTIDSPLVLCVNGDTIVQVDITSLLHAHICNGALATLVGSTRLDQPHPGAVVVRPDGWVHDIYEKEQDEGFLPGSPLQMMRLSNCGVYVFDRCQLKRHWSPCYSIGKLEQGLLKSLAAKRLLWAYPNSDRYVLDLGTEERLANARASLNEISTFFPI